MECAAPTALLEVTMPPNNQVAIWYHIHSYYHCRASFELQQLQSFKTTTNLTNHSHLPTTLLGCSEIQVHPATWPGKQVRWHHQKIINHTAYHHLEQLCPGLSTFPSHSCRGWAWVMEQHRLPKAQSPLCRSDNYHRGWVTADGKEPRDYLPSRGYQGVHRTPPLGSFHSEVS